MKIVTMIGGLALAAAISAPAAAAEFTGPRVEVHAGWDRLQADDPTVKLDQHRDGVSYGGGIGYDFALGERLIAGIDADFDLSSTDFDQQTGNSRVQADAKRDLSVAARIGARIGDRTLVYAKAGYTNARLEGVLTVGGTTGTTRTEFSGNADGLRAGAGVEVALAGKVYAKTEYLYSNYEKGLERHQLLAGIGLRF